MSRSRSRQKLVAGVVAATTLGVLALWGGATAFTSSDDKGKPTNVRYLEQQRQAAGEEEEPGDDADQGDEVDHPASTPDSGESGEIHARTDQYVQARLAPYGSVDAGLYGQAWTALNTLPATGTAWNEVTNQPYDSDDPSYRDPNFSNSGGGSGYVTGRVTGLAVGGGAVYAGGADGGVFRSTNGGTTWTAISDALPTLSTGDLKYDAATDSLWLATGEANTGGTSYVGTGVYRLVHPKTSVFTDASRVGGSELESRGINKIQFDGAGSVYAATTRGLWKHSASSAAGSWQNVFMPNPANDSDITKPYDNIVNDVAIQPGTGGQRVLLNAAWRSGAAYNGFYLSTNGGASFGAVALNPNGALNPKNVGNAEFAFSGDGKRLYTVVESPTLLITGRQSGNTVLNGVYVSRSGDVAGPWAKIADYRKLGNSGSALKTNNAGKGYGPGVQAWYNNFIAVDPTNSEHVYVGLEEVFESSNGGSSWTTPGPYWNFGFPCWGPTAATNTCPGTTHSDQHSIAIDVAGNRIYVGNDGGAYSRPLHGAKADALGHATDWTSLNRGLHLLQYYSVATGRQPGGGYSVSGGLQDNGGSLLLPGASTMVSPFGGDGGDVVVDPNDGCRILDEYTNLTLWFTTNCGRSDGTTSVIKDVTVPDPSSRFIAPVVADEVTGAWVAGGQGVWTNTKTWTSTGSADWTEAYDTGASHLVTAISARNGTIVAGWCGTVNCNSAGFSRGIATNYGGTWHQLDVSALPNRFVGGVTLDPAHADTVYVVFNGFNRRFIEGPGSGISGHVFKGVLTAGGGVTWTNVSGNMPDIPATSLVVLGAGHWVLGTDLGVIVTTDGGATWKRVNAAVAGTGTHPAVTVMELGLSPDGYLYSATHGRGIWRIRAASL